MRITFLLLLCLPLFLNAQRFGGTPPSVQWKQINTDSARIIFAAGLDSQAQRVANIVHAQAALSPVALGNKLKKIDIVLQDQTTIANGYVGLGPFRSEFYLTPQVNNFELGAIPWADQLAVHEYRHVQQYNHFNNGISKLIGTLFGQEGYALATNVSIPDWFFEGDAVYNETVLSQQGRGRLPLFLNAYPALWKAGKNYSWMKLRNGSLKDYVPGHYQLGYLLVNYGYEKYGAGFWGKVTRDASAFEGLFYPFQHAIKKHAGISYDEFRRQAFEYYRQLASQEASNESSSTAVFPANTRVVTNSMFPYATDEGTVFLQSAYDRRPSFVLLRDGKVNWLRVRDIAASDQFSYRNGKIVYAAYETHPRWRWRDYSVIKVLDTDTRRQRTLRHRTRYFTPDISPSGNRVAAVHIAPSGKSELHILDAADGSVKATISSGDINLFTDPKFIDEDSLVTAVRLENGRMALALANIATGSTTRLTPPSFNVVGFPSVYQGKVYFTASYGGRDQLHYIRLQDRSIYRMDGSPLGNYFVNAGAGKLSWSVFTAEGYQLHQQSLDAVTWSPVPAAEVEQLNAMFPVALEKTVSPLLHGRTYSRSFDVTSYKKSTRLINIHSWRPYYEDPEFSFSIYGQNILNTFETQLYYLYNENEKTHAAGVSFVYGGLFPYLSAGSQYTFSRLGIINNSVREFDQLDTRVGFSIPLSWVRNQTYRNLNVGSNFYNTQEFNRGLFKDSAVGGSFNYLHHFITWSEQVEMAPQHIYPRLGYALGLQYRHAITDLKSRQLLASGTVYFPGLLKTHNLVINANWQETGLADIRFASRFPYSRGYNAFNSVRLWGVRNNYHFPLIYPDWGFGNILYFQRVRLNAFYDFTRIFGSDRKVYRNQQSTGAELFVDTKWWNQYELSFGFRWSYLADRDLGSGQQGVTVFEFILPVSIIPR